MAETKSPWPVLAEQAQTKFNEAESVWRQAKAALADAENQRSRIVDMLMEYRLKLTQFERQSNLSDSVNCRQFLAQLVDLDVQAQLQVQKMQAAVTLAADRVKAARFDLDKMKKLVEREEKQHQRQAAQSAQRRMDEMATLRHSYKHA
jgi:flagellar biosynthesis chaperone FliJ